jgi:hypothetical protein
MNIISRFGRMDADLITCAINADTPVMIAVPEHRLAALVKFMNARLPCRREASDRWWRSVAGEPSCRPQNRTAQPRSFAACDPPRHSVPPMRRSTTGQMVEEVRGEHAGASLNDLHARRTCVILKGPS